MEPVIIIIMANRARFGKPLWQAQLLRSAIICIALELASGCCRIALELVSGFSRTGLGVLSNWSQAQLLATVSNSVSNGLLPLGNMYVSLSNWPRYVPAAAY